MAKKTFCDYCDGEMEPVDSQVFEQEVTLQEGKPPILIIAQVQSKSEGAGKVDLCVVCSQEAALVAVKPLLAKIGGEV